MPHVYGGPLLLDNSAWARIGLGRLNHDDLARCEAAVRTTSHVRLPFALEALYSARDAR